MMKKILVSLLVGACGAVAGHAVPAYPYPVEITQPDGSTVTLQLHGDEYSNYTTTLDGYTVVHSTLTGAWEYARVEADTLVSIGVIARDAEMRTAAEVSSLAAIPRHLSPTPSPASREMRRRARMLSDVAYPRVLGGTGRYDYSKFRGLVILVEFNDAPFSRTDINQVFTDMITQRDYTGFMTSGGLIAEKVEYTGSVRDYYYDNSCGQFDPQFDVVGPVKIDYPCTYPAQTARAQQVVSAALNAADDIVDYSRYDTDGDGVVDMVYFIFSGAGSNVSGNNSMYIWPHASQVFPALSRDGVTFGRYACSTELHGTPAAKVIDGIGTIVHEFSHVLGLPDLYDTDYESGGGQCVHPGSWSVMASGSYLNYSRTPCGYTLYERYSVGFAIPESITGAGDYTLEDVAVSNKGYRIDLPVDKEFFLLDNRRREGWNRYLPGEGMMVWRVDSTNVKVWDDNDVNANPSHPYLEVIRANPANPVMSGSAPRNTAGDPFPGSSNVTELSGTSTPALMSWNGSPSSLGLYDIAETASGAVTFTVRQAEVTTLVEDFESMPLTTDDASGVAGRFSPWTFTSAVVAEPLAAMGDAYGSRAAGISRGGSICSDKPVEQTVTSIAFDFYNPSASSVILRCGYTLDGDLISWLTPAGEASSMVTVTDHGGRFTFPVPDVAGARYYMEIRTGSRTGYHYVDNITLLCKGGSNTGITAIPADGGAISVVVTGDCVELRGCVGAEARMIDLAGRNVAMAAVAADGVARFSGLREGVYVVVCGSGVAKVMIR